MKRIEHISISLLVCFLLGTLAVKAQVTAELPGEGKEYLAVNFKAVSPTITNLYSIKNIHKEKLTIILNGKEDSVLKPGQTKDYGGVECSLLQVRIGYYGTESILNPDKIQEYWNKNAVKKTTVSADSDDVRSQASVEDKIENKEIEKTAVQGSEKPELKTVQDEPAKLLESQKQVATQISADSVMRQDNVYDPKFDANQSNSNASPMSSVSRPSVPASVMKPRQKVLLETAVGDFISELDASNSFFSKALTEELAETVRQYKIGLDTCSALQKIKFIKSQRIRIFLGRQKSDLSINEKRIGEYVSSFMDKYQVNHEIESPDACMERLTGLLSDRSELRTNLLKELENSMKIRIDTSLLKYILIILSIGLVIVLLSLRKVKSGGNSSDSGKRKTDGNDDGDQVVILQKSHDYLLKKQSLDDVRNSDSYYLLNSQDFCSDSAIRRIYLKNTCIKDIYNMYADDLRNPDKPNEDGCMVLGRWVLNPDDNKYDISLEYVVRPGDDAVFQEYELNFGGKIKMKVSEKLRKLRRETGLQYDLTCWVHSHPGLGVFFSNYDSNVQIQLKNPVHPHFLSAIVVDILTPRQEFGVFSFREDDSIISRNELKRMYSLEELYKWAVESGRKNFRPEDYYNILEGATTHTPECEGIEMGNNAIIDICSLISEHSNPSTYGIYGYPFCVDGRNEIIVKSVSSINLSEENEQVGCFYIGTHFSIPTIRKTLSDGIGNYKFVLFYSSVSEYLTVIPITEGHLVTDESYYSQSKLEPLKLWTRRRR